MTTLVETAVYLTIFTALLGTIAASFAGNKAYAVRAAVQSFAALLADARSVAQTSGTGATIVIADAAGGFTATLYPFRPLPGADTSTEPIRTLAGDVSLTPAAIFISSSATATSAGWSPGDGSLASEPPCASGITLEFNDGRYTESHAISCATAQMQ